MLRISFLSTQMENDFYDSTARPWKEANFDLKYFWAVFVALTALATTFANALVLLAVWKDPNKNLQRSPSNLLIASQAMADFFVGLVQEPLCAWWILTFSSIAVHAIEAVSSLFLVSSVLHAVALSFDRYVAVARPLQHNVTITKRRVFLWILVIWISSIVYMSYRTILRELNYSITLINIISGAHTVLPSVISVLFYIRLYCMLKNLRKGARDLDESGKMVINAYQRERNMTKAMVVALCLFLFCLTPWFVFYQVIGACPTCEEHESYQMYLFAIFYYIFTMKSLLNPFLYAWRLPKYKAVFKTLLKTGRNNHRRIEVINLSETSWDVNMLHKWDPTLKNNFSTGRLLVDEAKIVSQTRKIKTFPLI